MAGGVTGPGHAPKDDYILTYMGKRLYMQALDPENILLDDIIQALPQVKRYHGHTKHEYDVARHCLNVYNYLTWAGATLEERKWGFIHDWAEYATGDVASPYKPFVPALVDLENRILSALLDRNGLPQQMPEIVHLVDKRICRYECDVLKPNVPEAEKWWLKLQPLSYEPPKEWFYYLDTDHVRFKFHKLANELELK